MKTSRLDRFEKLAERFVVAIEKIADTHARQAEHGMATSDFARQLLSNPTQLLKSIPGLPTTDHTEEEPPPRQ